MSKSLREKIYEKIRDDITYGKYVPGERIVEDRLVEVLKASRSPIREALRQLQSEGLVTFERNRGILVFSAPIIHNHIHIDDRYIREQLQYII